MPLSEVVAIKVNGNEYDTTPPNVAGSGSGGNGGSAAKINDTNLLDGVSVSRYDAGVFGSTVLDNNTADKALNAGVFAYNNERPISKRVTTTLSTTNNNVLRSGAAVPSNVRSIHKVEVYRTRKLTSAIRAGKWNQYSGTFEAGYPQNVVDSVSSDNAANPSREYPGSLVYTNGSSSTATFYSKKTG